MSMAAAVDGSTPHYAIHVTFMMATTWWVETDMESYLAIHNSFREPAQYSQNQLRFFSSHMTHALPYQSCVQSHQECQAQSLTQAPTTAVK